MTFDTNKMAKKVQEALIQASSLAERYRQSELEPEHLLLVMLGQTGGVVPLILSKLSIPIEDVTMDMRRAMARYPAGPEEIQMAVSQRLRYLLMNAQEEAERYGDSLVGGEHILLALVSTAKGKRGAKRAAQSGTMREAGDIFLAYGVTQEALLRVLDEVRRMQTPSQQTMMEPLSSLEEFGRNLVVAARSGELDPVVGREEEMGMVIQVLAQNTQNNPILVGGDGVGKTSIVEGLAEAIARGAVPSSFHDKEIVALDREALVAGTKNRSQFEERVKAVFREAIENPSVILFIDDLETMMGGSVAEGHLDLANILMPMLSRFELRFIGACSREAFESMYSIGRMPDYSKYFQTIPVEPPSVEDTILILRGIRHVYEGHHGVTIADEALVAASALSHKYMVDRYLPEKAIDLIDEAAARVRMEIMKENPVASENLHQHLQQMEQERDMLAQGAGAAEREKLRHLTAEINELKAQLGVPSQGEKAAASGPTEAIARLRNEIDQVQNQIIQAQDSFDTLKAADLQFCVLPNLEAELAVLEQQAFETRGSEGGPVPEKEVSARPRVRQVTEVEIQRLVAQYADLPMEKVASNPSRKLINMEEVLQRRLIGQHMAVEALANAVRRSRSGLVAPNRPLGAFLFLGPSGVGKTVMAKALAEVLFESDLKLARLDLSMYADRNAIIRLIGDPASGDDTEVGHLIEIIQHDPEIVLILDAIEKANADVQSLFQQILEDGYLSDGEGQVLSFKDTVLVMKSSVGADLISQLSQSNQGANVWPALQAELGRHLRQEFLVSLDEIIVFDPLRNEDLIRLIDLNLMDLQQRLADKGMTIRLTHEAYHRLIVDANVPGLGARLLKRVIQQKIQNPVAMKILQGQFTRESILVDVSHTSGEIIFTPG
ncbi:MAG: ATP-dependent Clp protease ATP-binding subunit [Peptococcaceae bacterium]|nr:ATP-dependent Clp protease ATP-binding subunit [Peptococcaceae bacterium]